METVALAAWRGGDTRVASESRFHDTLKIMNTQDVWEEFKRDNGPDVANLAMNFYMKSSEIDSRGFEFTHKSFGDYLTARSILRIAADVSEMGERHLDHTVKDWLDATCTGELTDDLLDFIRDEARRTVSGSGGVEKIDELKRGFQRIANFAITDGLPAHGNISQTWRSAESFQNAAEIMVWAVMNACSLALSEKEPELAKITLKWPNDHSFGRLIARLTRQSVGSECIRKCFSNVVADGAHLFGLVLSHADFSGAKLARANLNGTHLINANLSDANLEGTKLQRAHLDGANLCKANLAGAILWDARLRRTKFYGADLTGAQFSRYSLEDDDITLKVDALKESEVIEKRIKKRRSDKGVVRDQVIKTDNL